MKKLLVLVLVLGMASFANATVSLYLNGSPADAAITIGIDETITIQVYSDDTSIYPAYVINGADDPLSIGLLDNAVSLSGAGNMAGTPQPYEAGGGWGPGFLFTTAGSPPTPGIVAGVQHEVDFSSSEAGVTTVYLYEGNDPYGELDSIEITVPEPATIALLCLGGLLLRKK